MERLIDINPEGDSMCSYGKMRLKQFPTWNGKWMDFSVIRSAAAYQSVGDFSGTIAGPAAIELRDALIELYPVDTAPKQEVRYEVEYNSFKYEWRVFETRTNVLTDKRAHIATCDGEAAAKRIIAALEAA